MVKFHKRTLESIFTAVILAVLCFYWVGILCINLSKDPSFYYSDMYSDILYSMEVWNQKKIFPEGWIFGNQLYFVATPVLAALCYGITNSPCVAMGIASTLMGLGVVASFYWMIKQFFQSACERLFAVVCFMTIVLLSGNPVSSLNGWQLFFTMCSYYACYAIAVFLGFGCYLRNDIKWNRSIWLLFAIACFFSFGTGVQSLRQTAIMIVPLVAVEAMRIFHSIVRKRKYNYKSTFVAGVLSGFNLLGVLYADRIVVEKNEIFGNTSFQVSRNFLEVMLESCETPFYLFSSFRHIAMVLFGIVCILFAFSVFLKKDWPSDPVFVCILLCIASVVVIWGVDVFTAMEIREIYYFLLYPMAAVGITWIYSKMKNNLRTAAIAMSLLAFLGCGERLMPYIHRTEAYHSYRQISDYLEEEGITTLYSHWNLGDRIAIASDFRIQAGFWRSRSDPFNAVRYLCNPAVFDVDATECAYIVRGDEVFEKTKAVAQSRGADLLQVKEFPELNLYLFTADIRLMR